MKLKPKLVALFIAIALVPTGLYSVLIFGFTQIYMVRAQLNSLTNITDIKLEAINRYFTNLRQIADFAQDFYNVKTNLPILDDLHGNTGDPTYIQATTMLDEQLKPMARALGFYEIQLISKNDRLVYSTADVGIPDDESQEDKVAYAMGKKQIFIGDIHRNPAQNDRLELMVTAPVYDFENQFAGSMDFIVNLSSLYSLTSEYAGLGNTGESLLARRTAAGDSILFLNPLRHEPDAALNRTVKIGSPDGLAIQNAVSGQNGAGQTLDYRGEQVLAVWRYLPSLRWGFVTKIDMQEVYSDTNNLATLFALGAILVILIVVLTAFLVSNYVINPIKILQDGTVRIAKGDLGFRVPVMGRDEIGHLANNFNFMTARLAESYAGLEQKVRDRTEALSRAKSQDDAILAAIGDGVMACDRKGTVILFNRIAESLTGFKSAEVIGKRHEMFFRLVQEENRTPAEDFMDRAMRTGKSLRITKGLLLIRKDGTEVPVADSVSPVTNDKGDKVGCVVVFRDIRQEREIDRMKTEFVSIAAHQLKGPLTAINWLVEALSDDKTGKLSARQKKHIDDIIASDKQMVGLVNDLLNVSRIETGRLTIAPQPTQFEKLIDDVIRNEGPLLAMKQCQLTFDRPKPTLPLVQLDGMLMRQVVHNLVSNAVRYSTPGKGMVSIRLEERPDDQDYLLTVSDNGIGIPKDKQNKIFQKFFRAENAQRSQSEGTGLGLYITKMIVENSGGKIWFESEENVGTDFYVSLPLSGMAAKAGEKSLAG